MHACLSINKLHLWKTLNSCIIPSLPIAAVVECSAWDQVVTGLSPIACLFVYSFVCSFVFITTCTTTGLQYLVIVGHPEPEKKILLAFLSTFWHPCSKCILMCSKEDRGGCQVWKCPKAPELGQRSTECKLLYIRQILAFLSISYPKLWLKVMQNFFWIIQPCYINKQHHQGMIGVWIKGHLSAKSVKIVAIFMYIRAKLKF